MSTVDHLELIVWSVLAAAAAVTTIGTLVAALAYLLFRDHAPAPVAAPEAEPKAAPAPTRAPTYTRPRAAAATPVAVAG